MDGIRSAAGPTTIFSGSFLYLVTMTIRTYRRSFKKRALLLSPSGNRLDSTRHHVIGTSTDYMGCSVRTEQASKRNGPPMFRIVSNSMYKDDDDEDNDAR